MRLRGRHEDGNPQPWGEPGSVEYWIEAMKRAYELGEG